MSWRLQVHSARYNVKHCLTSIHLTHSQYHIDSLALQYNEVGPKESPRLGEWGGHNQLLSGNVSSWRANQVGVIMCSITN
jgi:hypothetical protein